LYEMLICFWHTNTDLSSAECNVYGSSGIGKVGRGILWLCVAHRL
jgi:hypothetical protein